MRSLPALASVRCSCRSSFRASLAIAFTLVSGAGVLGCKREEPPPEKKPERRPDVRRTIDRTPLPPLASSPRGATGKPIWGTSFGGLGIDSPRAIAIAPGGDSYVVGYFDGATDLGPAGKHRAAANPSD